MATKKSVLLQNIPEKTKERIRKDKTQLSEDNYKGNSKPEYTRLQYVRIYKGYDLMENLIFVRSAIQRKYNIDVRMLEQVLFLTPKNLFTLADFKDVAQMNFSYRRIENIMEEGFVSLASKGRNKLDHIYTATAKARKLTQEFHEMLSGEIPIEFDSLEKTNYKSDGLKSQIIKKLNKKEKPKTVQMLWARKV